MGFVDMHIHSTYSDGSYTPDHIVSMARARNVSLISVCDHNEIRGTLQAKRAAEVAGIGYITGVEIDSLYNDLDMHILCYNADLNSEPLLRRIHHARKMLDGMSTDLLRKMCADGYHLSVDEYDAYEHDTSLGGWKMLDYLVSKGVTKNLKSGFEFYERYGISYSNAGFDTVREIIDAIHEAGGRAVLAHPGVSLPCEHIQKFESYLNDLIDMGIDGIECHYPAHGRGITQTCLRVCEERGKMITAGSDCHGAFNHNDIGCTHIAEDRIELNGLQY